MPMNAPSKILLLAIVLFSTTPLHGAEWRRGRLAADFLAHLRKVKERASAFFRTKQFVRDERGTLIETLGGLKFRLHADLLGSLGKAGPDEGEGPAVRELAALLDELPAAVDRRPLHARVRNQWLRGTCAAFACCALIEGAVEGELDVSEEDAYWLFMRQERIRAGKDGEEADHPTIHDDPGTTYDVAIEALTTGRICPEKSWKYRPFLLPRLRQGPTERPEKAVENAAYGYVSTVVLGDDEIGDMDVMAPILAAGHDVAIGVEVAWDEKAMARNDGVVDVVLDEDGEPAEPEGGHGLVVVGYDRAAGHFIVRNSWGRSWGDEGYCYMTSDYLRTYGLGGFYLDEVAAPAPAPAP